MRHGRGAAALWPHAARGGGRGQGRGRRPGLVPARGGGGRAGRLEHGRPLPRERLGCARRCGRGRGLVPQGGRSRPRLGAVQPRPPLARRPRRGARSGRGLRLVSPRGAGRSRPRDEPRGALLRARLGRRRRPRSGARLVCPLGRGRLFPRRVQPRQPAGGGRRHRRGPGPLRPRRRARRPASRRAMGEAPERQGRTPRLAALGVEILACW